MTDDLTTPSDRSGEGDTGPHPVVDATLPFDLTDSGSTVAVAEHDDEAGARLHTGELSAVASVAALESAPRPAPERALREGDAGDGDRHADGNDGHADGNGAPHATATMTATATATATTERPVAPSTDDERSRAIGRRARSRAAGGKLGYIPALDGLRAVAVLLVLGYHLGYSGLAGGYVGVEVFFVLSGWLVCALLMGERRATGRISLSTFWLRRARRLLPAMALVIVGTLAVATVADPSRVADLRSDAVAAVTYHLNWRLILDRQSYFAAAEGPSALEHLWSLSIEEQFYLVFPLLAAGLLARRRTGWRVAIVLAAAGVSTILRFAWYEPGTDPSDVYFSTVTRGAGLLAGVFLGLFWVPRRLRPRQGRVAPRVLDLVALSGLAVVFWYAITVTEADRSAFRGAFTLVQVATLATIAAVVVPGPSLVTRALGARPLRWVGQRSYGIYLIHWPVIVFTARAPGQQPEAAWKVALQVLAVGVLAALSYRLVEEPIRRDGVAATWRRARAGVDRVVTGRPLAASGALAAVIVAAGATYGVARDVVVAEQPRPHQPRSVVISATTVPGRTTTTTLAPAAAPTTAAPVAAPAPPAAAPAPVPGAYPATTAVGDSVMVGAAEALAQRMGPSLMLDALIGRQMEEAPALFHSLADTGQLGSVVVIHLGNNGPFTDQQIDEVLGIIGPERRVVLVNVFVPRRWEGEVNDRLQAAAARHPNTRIADWRSLPAADPSLLIEDGYHLSPVGRQRYADLVTATILGP